MINGSKLIILMVVIAFVFVITVMVKTTRPLGKYELDANGNVVIHLPSKIVQKQ